MIATKVLLVCAAFVALAATSQMIRRTRTVYMRPMGYVTGTYRRVNLAMSLYTVALLLAAIAWVVYP